MEKRPPNQKLNTAAKEPPPSHARQNCHGADLLAPPPDVEGIQGLLLRANEDLAILWVIESLDQAHDGALAWRAQAIRSGPRNLAMPEANASRHGTDTFGRKDVARTSCARSAECKSQAFHSMIVSEHLGHLSVFGSLRVPLQNHNAKGCPNLRRSPRLRGMPRNIQHRTTYHLPLNIIQA